MTPQERTDIIQNKYGARFQQLMGRSMQLLGLPRNLDWRAKQMLEIANEIAAMAMPVSPCKKGCSYCCYQAIVISSWEAAQIAKMTGRKIVNFNGRVHGKHSRQEVIEKYKGEPCPFLVNNECSIYTVRPFICRTHISAADDSFLCDIENNANVKVPYFNFGELNMIQGYLFVGANCKFGDIREFFG